MATSVASGWPGSGKMEPWEYGEALGSDSAAATVTLAVETSSAGGENGETKASDEDEDEHWVGGDARSTKDASG